MKYISSSDLSLISHWFPLLEVLDLSCPTQCYHSVVQLSFFKLRKINLSYHSCIDDKFILHLFKSCKLLEEVIMLQCFDITFDGIATALRKRPTLRSVSFSNTFGRAYWWRRQSTYITSQFISSLVSLKYLTSLDLLSLNILDELLSSIANEGLPLTKLVLQGCTGYSYSGIFSLLSKCQHFQHLDLQNAVFLNDEQVVEMSSFLVDLEFINLTHCSMLTESSFFALLKHGPLLSEIKMEHTCIGKKSLESSKSLMDFVACPQLKYLRLAQNPWLFDEYITMLASIFSNL